MFWIYISFFIFKFLIVTKAECPDGSIEGLPNSNTCYVLSQKPDNWYDAERYCSQYGGHATSIGSSFENTYIAGIEANDFNYSEFWIGAYNDVGYNYFKAGPWGWSDGSNLSYANWDSSKYYFEKK